MINLFYKNLILKQYKYKILVVRFYNKVVNNKKKMKNFKILIISLMKLEINLY